MSDFGEEIINRLPAHSSLHKSDNPMRRIIDDGLGSWLDNFEDEDFFNQFFLESATDGYLDVWGRFYGVKRKIDESDEDYRKRIIYTGQGHLTVDYLVNLYDMLLYTYVSNFSIEENSLISDNPYNANNGFYGLCDEVTQEILDKKFILDNGVEWL